DFQSESSKKIKKRIQKARDIQTRRYRKTRLVCNSDLSAKDIKEKISLSAECIKLLRQAVGTLHLSARTYFRTIKIARTIADLAGEKEISVSHMAESLQYRPKEMGA
ncbi:magnesium chelatase, partial [Candidatus Gottesmanbacteria bacterium]|nr:magnesium chelatase [Candidatus Gottesmanbacteria bacterium]